MNWSNELQNLIRRRSQSSVITYLKQLSWEERIALGKELKNSWENFSEFAPINWHDSQKNREQAALIAFSGGDRETFEEFETQDLLTSPFFEEEVMPWYTPEWLGKYVDKLSQQYDPPTGLTYQWVIRSVEKGYFTVSKALIARLLPMVIFTPSQGRWENMTLTPEALFERPVTLSTHIGYLFEYDSILHEADSPYMMGKQVKDIWKQELKELIDSQHLDRNRVLQACLGAIQNPQLKPGLRSWFAAFFAWLSPDQTELITLQLFLFPILRVPSSRPIHMILGSLTKIAAHSDFLIADFLPYTAMLMAHPVKSVSKNCLILFSKIAAAHAQYRKELTQTACLGFEHSEPSTQDRISQFLLQYGDENDPVLREELIRHKNKLLPATRRQLTKFLSEASEKPGNPIPLSPTESIDSSFLPPGSPETKILSITTLSGLVFLAEKAIHNQKPWHLLQLVDAIIRLNPQIQEENLAPVVKSIESAIQVYHRPLAKHQGNLDGLLSLFLIEYGSLLLQQFGVRSHDLLDISSRNYFPLPRRGSRNTIFPDHEGQWALTEQGPTAYSIFLRLINYALDKLKSGDSLPLLSTPTHAPHWIDPIILVQRMIDYQTAKIQAHPIDLQLALSRVILTDSGAAGELAEARLNGEWMDLMCFLLFQNERPRESVEDEAAWLIAAATKDSQEVSLAKQRPGIGAFRETFSWKIVRTLQTDPTGYQLQLSFKTEKEEKSTGFREKVKGIFKREKNHFSLFSHLNIGKVSSPHFSADIARIFSILPHFPERWIARLLPHLQTANLPAIQDEKVVIATLRILTELPEKYAEASHLFVAASCFCNRKNVRLLAIETWIAGVSRNLIDSKRFGEITGQLISGKYGPAKRMVTLMNQHMTNISALHNLALETTLSTCIPHLPDASTTATLEILTCYQQLLKINSSHISSIAVQNRLNSWDSHRRLKKVIEQLKKYIR